MVIQELRQSSIPTPVTGFRFVKCPRSFERPPVGRRSIVFPSLNTHRTPSLGGFVYLGVAMVLDCFRLLFIKANQFRPGLLVDAQ
jgi:hypothetical protein